MICGEENGMNGIKEYYSLIVAVLDEDGNRVDKEEIVGSNNVEIIRSNRKELDNEIASGKYDRLKEINTS